MKMIDMRLRPPFRPYLGEGGMFDMESEHPFGVKNFYKNFGICLILCGKRLWKNCLQKWIEQGR